MKLPEVQTKVQNMQESDVLVVLLNFLSNRMTWVLEVRFR